MKTTILILTILTSILFSNIIMAGDKNELKLSYGYSGAEYFIRDFNLSNCPSDITFGTIGLSYGRKINEKMSIGAGLNYIPVRSPMCADRGSKNEHYVIPYVKFDYRHIVKPNFELYSAASIAVPFIYFSHLTIIGFRKGNKHAFFGEIGIGGGQVVAAGYSFKL